MPRPGHAYTRTPEETARAMITEISNALYPLLHPVEQQDCAIQARNHARMTELATMVWSNFTDPVEYGATFADMHRAIDAFMVEARPCKCEPSSGCAYALLRQQMETAKARADKLVTSMLLCTCDQALDSCAVHGLGPDGREDKGA